MEHINMTGTLTQNWINWPTHSDSD